MTNKKEGPFRRFAQAVREIRMQPPSSAAVEKFNCIVERNERLEPAQDAPKPGRKIARLSEARDRLRG